MPYTPPTARSPVSTGPAPPTISRTHGQNKSQQHGKATTGPASRPGMPRSVSSASYLHMHRRSPSTAKSTSFAAGQPTPDTSPLNDTSPEDTNVQPRANESSQRHYSQRPADNARSLSSPPDSAQNSSDDDNVIKRGRVRSLENLAELQAAIRTIEQHRRQSPDRISEETKKARTALGHDVPRLDTSVEEHAEYPMFLPRPPLSEGARKISHSRSSTDGSAFLDFPRNKFDDSTRSTSESDGDEDEGNDLRVKPPMVRKKSGELVRPALRAPSLKRRPSSMPGTPTYGKAVHFDSRLEHVRHFLQVDRPVAVSAGTSPVDSQDEDTEFPFNYGTGSYSPPFEWDIRLTNFPIDTLERRSAPVKVERVFLSADKKNLMGAVLVRNLAFHKLVVARFTFDYWKTTSEVIADFNNDIRRKQPDDGYDPFIFSIKLEDQNNLEYKTLFFCVKYTVNGQDYWDNNNSVNYQVDFSKAKPQSGKQASAGNASLRSKPASSLPSGRPRSMPISADDFSYGFGSESEFLSRPQPPAQVVGDSPIRFRNSKAAGDIVPDHPGLRTSAMNQAFGNRYDFGASLSAAINAASNTLGDRSGTQMREEVNSASTKLNSKKADGGTSGGGNPSSGAEKPAKDSAATKPNSSKPVALVAEKPPMQSSSYSELIDKYCFFGSTKATSPLKKPPHGQSDGASTEQAAVGQESTKTPEMISPLSSQQTPPSREQSRSTSKAVTPRMSGASSPVLGPTTSSRTASPVSFGYPYHQSMQNSFFPEAHAPTAIRG